MDDSKKPSKKRLKVAIFGAPKVGKKSAVRAFAKQVFDDQYHAVSDLQVSEVALEDPYADGTKDNVEQIVAQFWYCSAQNLTEKHKSRLYSGAMCIFIMYDVTDYSSFQYATTKCFQEATQRAPDAFVILVGCKSDKVGSRAVDVSEVESFSSSNDIFFMEVSALSGSNIDLTLSILRIRCKHVISNQLAATLPLSKAPPSVPSSTDLPGKKQPIKLAGGHLSSSPKANTVSTLYDNGNMPQSLTINSILGRNFDAPSTRGTLSYEAPAAAARVSTLASIPAPETTVPAAKQALVKGSPVRGAPISSDRRRSELNITNDHPGSRFSDGLEQQATASLSGDYEHLKRLFETTFSDVPRPTATEQGANASTDPSTGVETFTTPGGAGPTTLRVHRSGSIDVTTGGGIAMGHNGLHIGHASPKSKVPLVAQDPSVSYPPRAPEASFPGGANTRGRADSRTERKESRRTPETTKPMRIKASDMTVHAKATKASMMKRRGSKDNGSVTSQGRTLLKPRTTVPVSPKLRTNTRRRQSSEANNTHVPPHMKYSPVTSKVATRSGSMSGESVAKSSSVAPDIYIDVNIAGELIGTIGAREGDNAAQLAFEFVRKHELSPSYTAKLTNMVQRRVDEFCDTIAKQEQDSRKQQLNAMRKKLSQVTKPNHPQARLHDAHYVGHQQDRRVLGRLNVQVGGGRVGVLVVREGDRPRDLARNFCRTYGLHTEEALEIEARICDQMDILPRSPSAGHVPGNRFGEHPQPQAHLRDHPPVTRDHPAVAANQASLTPSQQQLLRRTLGLADQQHPGPYAQEMYAESHGNHAYPHRSEASGRPRRDTGDSSRPDEEYSFGSSVLDDRGEIDEYAQYEHRQPKHKVLSAERPMFNLDVDIGKGRTERIVVFANDDPYDLAERFIHKFQLDNTKIPKLEALLRDNMDVHTTASQHGG